MNKDCPSNAHENSDMDFQSGQYRIYYSLHKLDETNTALSKKLTNIKNDIVFHRSSGNINKANFNLINCYNNKHSLKDIINNFNNYIMNILDVLLPKYIK